MLMVRAAPWDKVELAVVLEMRMKGEVKEKMRASNIVKMKVIDEMGMRQGQALLPFRSAFSTKPDTTCPFKVSPSVLQRVTVPTFL